MAVAKQRLYRTVDDRVVFEGDPDAVALLAGVGDEIPEGFKAPKGASGEPDAPEAEEKAAEKPANKAVKKSANK